MTYRTENIKRAISSIEALKSYYDSKAKPRRPLKAIRWALCVAKECMEKQISTNELDSSVKTNEDMKLGYNIGCQRLNEELDTMIDELHNAYINHTDQKAKERLDAQIKILWSFKSRIEDAIVIVKEVGGIE